MSGPGRLQPGAQNHVMRKVYGYDILSGENVSGGVGGGGGGAMGCKGTCMGIVWVDLEIKGTTGLENRFNTMRLLDVLFLQQ